MTNRSEELKLLMLKSAKENLSKMKFFGLSEYMVLNKYLFERTFRGLKFPANNDSAKSGSNFNQSIPMENEFKSSTSELISMIQASKPQLVEEIQKHIKYDKIFYQFAKDLYFFRIKVVLEKDARFLSTSFYRSTFVKLKTSSDLEFEARNIEFTLKELNNSL